jgi:hypothetical protein
MTEVKVIKVGHGIGGRPQSRLRPNRIRWSVVRFDRFDGLILPEVLVADPDWFFWAYHKPIFEGRHAEEAEILCQRASHIRIPKRAPKRWRVEYCYDVNDRFQGCSIVKADSYMHSGRYESRFRGKCFDMSSLRHQYDKKGGRYLIRDFLHYYFDGEKPAKEELAAFFSDDSNFVLDG